ncbi:pyridoxal phosphate-dependent decarboxylase family protein [Mariniblastus fucicola]|uniref:L-2,4-diaminobutyrate decarboxylase n=1 Tax=Mariniblastus fucicola TaxID=980251 RepID=A0A5B9PE18_9BACT|nr:pyridoxal-dependent decarboxylase [Mariniblastus fucicola]QEG22816.1 L-2,4-diaminobutyrate decarboxylase [Mariniblastus fucicola]
MHHRLENDKNHIRQLLEKVTEQSAAYVASLDNRPTSIDIDAPDNSLDLPQDGVGAAATLALFNQRFEPHMVASSGPRYWGFVIGGTTPASLIGDWLASAYDQNTQTIDGQGDVSARVELETINLLLDLFHLPRDVFLGGFVTGATMSNFTCLGVARQWYGHQLGRDFAKDGVNQTLNILSATPHSSAIKALSMLGIGSRNIIQVESLPEDREAMDVADLRRKLNRLDGQPGVVIASAGTVNTVDFDDFMAIHQLKSEFSFWLHVDAAFGGFAACSDNHRHLLDGWEHADSITIDCHKWLNVPYDSAVFLVRQQHRNHQVATFQNSNAAYLGDPMQQFNYLNLLPENSRRFRALPAWFSLQAYGSDGYQEIVHRCIELAQHLSDQIERSEHFRLIGPTRLNNLCFTLKANFESDEAFESGVTKFLDELNSTGKVFMTPTRLGGISGIRCSLVNWTTDKKDVDLVFELMCSIAGG